MLTAFSVGQVWQYQTRDHEPDSRITIVRIDADDKEFGNIIHIYISDVDIPNEDAPQGKTTYIGHMPYDEGALELCVTKKEADLLVLLAKNSNRTLDRNIALKAIWGDDTYFNARSMDVYIAKLRKIISKDQGISILTDYGHGFKLIVES